MFDASQTKEWANKKKFNTTIVLMLDSLQTI